MISADVIGSIAGILTTLCYMPQVYHCYKSKQVAGISMGMYSILTLGIGMWFAYGIMLMSWPLIISNIITLTMIFMIIVMKFRYGDKKTQLDAVEHADDVVV